MKIKYECKYNVDEVSKLIQEQHAAKYPLPDGMKMKWVGVWESYSGVSVTAIKDEEDNTQDTKSEVPGS